MPGSTGLAALILAPIVWSVHLLAVYVASALVCERGGSVQLIPPLALGITILAGIALALLGVAAWRRSRQPAEAVERQIFVRNVALLVIAISAVGLVWNTLPGVMTPTCS
jgi:hypothetical protein